jgi:hypothetical protein
MNADMANAYTASAEISWLTTIRKPCRLPIVAVVSTDSQSEPTRRYREPSGTLNVLSTWRALAGAPRRLASAATTVTAYA